MSAPRSSGDSTTTNGSSGDGGPGTVDSGKRNTVVLAAFITIIVIAVGGIAIAGLFLVGSETGLAVTAIDVNDSGIQNEPVVVTVTVENTADATVTDDIELQIGEAVSLSREIQVAGGETATISFDVERTEDLSTETSLSVSTGFDSAQDDFSMQEATIGVEVRSVSDPVVEGQDLLVEAIIRNTGSRGWTDGDVTLQTEDGVVRDSAQVSVDPGEDTAVELVWETDSGASSIADIMVQAGESTARSPVDIQAVGGSAFFIVDIVDAPDTMALGESRTLTADIENLATVAGSATVTVTSDGFQNIERTVEIGGGETVSETVTLEATATGTHTVRTDSGDTQDQRQITVLEPGDLEIGSLTANNPTEGDPLDISFTVTNAGDTPISGTIGVDAGSLGTTSIGVDLAGGEQTQKSTSLSTSAGDSGEYTVSITYEQQTVSTHVSVQAADDDDDDDDDDTDPNDSSLFSLAISSISPPDPVAGQEVTVTVAVTNNDEVTRPDTLRLTGDGVADAETGITVSGGATETATISSRFTTNIQKANLSLETAQFGGSASRTVNLESYAFGDTASIQLDPSQDQSITGGEGIEFSATATDTFGNQFTDDSQFTWQAEGAEISSSGTFTEPDAEQYEVTAELDGVISPATTVTVEGGGVETVEIDPATDTIITAGASLNFDATARDAQGNIIEDSAQAFSWSGPVADSGEFTAVEAGEYQISASYDGVSSTTTGVTVQPANVDQVTISGDLQPTAGETVTLSATAVDQYGNIIETDTTAFDWSGENVSSDGQFQSETASEQGVTATYDGTSGTGTVDVQPAAATTVEIDPVDDQSIFSGQEIRFQAAAYDQYGNLVLSQDSQFNWDASGGNITDTGIFEETSTGSYDVTATYNGIISDPTTVTVN